MMEQNLENDLLEFKTWYLSRLELMDNVIKAAQDDPVYDPEELAQLRRAKLSLMERSARKLIDVYANYGFYPDL
jgi:hypothetical protein